MKINTRSALMMGALSIVASTALASNNGPEVFPGLSDAPPIRVPALRLNPESTRLPVEFPPNFSLALLERRNSASPRSASPRSPHSPRIEDLFASMAVTQGEIHEFLETNFGSDEEAHFEALRFINDLLLIENVDSNDFTALIKVLTKSSDPTAQIILQKIAENHEGFKEQAEKALKTKGISQTSTTAPDAYEETELKKYSDKRKKQKSEERKKIRKHKKKANANKEISNPGEKEEVGSNPLDAIAKRSAARISRSSQQRGVVFNRPSRSLSDPSSESAFNFRLKRPTSTFTTVSEKNDTIEENERPHSAPLGAISEEVSSVTTTTTSSSGASSGEGEDSFDTFAILPNFKKVGKGKSSRSSKGKKSGSEKKSKKGK